MGSDGWESISLRQAGVDLIDCEHRTPPAESSGFPYIAIPQLKDGHLELKGARLISRDSLAEWTRKAKPEEGDIVLSRRCNPGDTAVVPNGLECALGQNLVLLRADGTRVSPSFLRWLVRSPAWWEQVALYINAGAVFDSLKCADIPSFRLPIPSMAEQDRISEVLDTLDDKIERNRRMNRTLESIARAIFRSWFVDFDPVRRTMEVGEVGLPPDVAALFPDSFEESALGQLPAGWAIKTIENVAERVAMGPFGSSIKVETLVPDGVPVINGQQLGGLTLEDASYRFVTKAHADELSRANVKRGDIVLTHRGTLGQAAFIAESSLYERYVVSQSQFYLRCDLEQVNPAFIVLYFHSDAGRHALLANRSSSGVPSIARPVTYLRSIRLLIPPKPVMDAFGELVTPLFELARQRSASNRTAASLRDALLPRLLDGRLSAVARDLPNSMEASGPCLVQKHP